MENLKIVELLPDMVDRDLTSLEENCHRLMQANDPKITKQASLVIEAIALERGSRKISADRKLQKHFQEISKANAGLNLRERTINAFKGEPASEREACALALLASNPGLDHNELAEMLDYKDGGAVNLLFGTLCRRREAYFGQAPESPIRRGEKFYSGLIVDLEEEKSNGERESRRHLWHLKPEVKQGLIEAGVVLK